MRPCLMRLVINDLFKLGDYFEIKSKTVTTSFEVKLDVEQWENEESNNWDFPFFSYQENLCNSLESIDQYGIYGISNCRSNGT